MRAPECRAIQQETGDKFRTSRSIPSVGRQQSARQSSDGRVTPTPQ